MKLKKLLQKAEKILDPKKREVNLKKKGLKKLIKKLRHYEHETRKEADAETDPDQKHRLEKKILVAHAQRKKALEILDD